MTGSTVMSAFVNGGIMGNSTEESTGGGLAGDGGNDAAGGMIVNAVANSSPIVAFLFPSSFYPAWYRDVMIYID